MKKMVRIFFGLMVFCFFMADNSFGKTENDAQNEEKTLSPYFMVKSEDPDTDRLPLKSTRAEADIAGVIADVRVTQVYANEGERPIEAVYVFPASTRAAVYGMKMTIGERVIQAKIEKRKQARQQYEKAKKEGKSASLLEQQRPNVFQMNVANILPGDRIEVELKYTELLVPTDGIYEFVYPTVVGPRYSNLPEKSAPESEKWVKNPYLHEGEAPPYTFDLKINLSTGLPIREATCETHRTNIDYEGKSFAAITLAESEKYGGNRDFVLKYRLTGGRIETGLLLYEGEEENFFLSMVQPPERVESETIVAREYIFIVDVSGSMNGFPLDISKVLLRNLIRNLKPEDRFNVMLFASASAVMSEEGSVAATEENIERALDVIDRQQGGGGTEILPALQRSFSLPQTEGMSRSIVVVTDGYVRVEPEVFDLIRNRLNEANLFAFGIGTGVNRHLIEGMANVGMGEPFVVLEPLKARKEAVKFREYISSPVLTDIEIYFEDFDAYAVEPPSIPDVLAKRPVICFGKWRNQPGGIIELKGHSAGGAFTHRIDVSQTEPTDKHSALRYLWARHRIRLLGDYQNLQKDDQRAEKITGLGLKYNLLTEYTSFIAVDTRVRREGGKVETVKQPLPLPAGVSDRAVGFGAAVSGKSRAGSRPLRMKSPRMLGIMPDREAVGSEPEEKIDLAYKRKTPVKPLSIEKIAIDNKRVSGKKVRELVENNLSDIQKCIRKKGASGKIVVKLILDQTGKPVSVSIERDDTKMKSNCFIKRVKQWDFSKLNLTGKVVVSIIFRVSA